MSRALTLTLTLTACAPQAGGGGRGEAHEPAPEVDDSATPDTGSPCAEGELLDGERCVPEACGTGTWGELLDGDDAVHVQAGAPAGGDGSRAAPLSDPQAAADLAGSRGGGRVLLAEGTYTGEITLLPEHAGVSLHGRCSALVMVEPGEDVSAVFAGSDDPDDTYGLHGLTLRSSYFTGALLGQGTFELRDVQVLDPGSFALAFSGPNTADVQGVRIRETRADAGGTTHALSASSEAIVDARDVVIEDLQGHALHAGVDGVLRVRDAVVSRCGPREWSRAGVVTASDGRLECTDCIVEDTVGIALSAQQPAGVLRFEGGRVEGIQPREGAAAAGGASATDGATVTVLGATLADIEGVGIEAARAGSITLEDTTLAGVRPVTGSIATAAGALEGGVLVLRRTTVRDVDGSGVYVAEADTQATLEDVGFERVGRAAGTEHGSVAVARDGATLTWTGGGASESTAVVLEAAGGAVRASDLEIDGIAAGVEVEGLDTHVGAAMLASGGSLEADAVAVAGATGLGALLAGEATAHLVDVSFRDTAPHPDGSTPTDVFVAQGAQLTGERVTLASDDARALWAQEPGTMVSLTEATAGPSSRLGLAAIDGATLELHASRIESRSRVGLYASGTETTLDLEDVLVDGTRDDRDHRYGVGVLVLVGAAGTASGLEVADTDGPGLAVEAASMACTGCALLRNVAVGAADLGGELTLTDSVVLDTQADPEVGGYGIWAETTEGVGALTVDGGRLEGNATAALWLTGPGAWRVVDTALSGGEGWAWRAGRVVHGDAIVARGGIAPWDGERGLWIDNATLRDAAGAGLLLHGSGATLGEVSFAGNASDVWVQGCAAGEPVVEGLGDIPAEWCPEGDRLMLDPDIGNIVQLGGITSD